MTFGRSRARPKNMPTPLPVLLLGLLSVVSTRRPRLWEPPLRWFTISILFALVCEATAYALVMSGRTNRWVYNLYSPLEFGAMLIYGLNVARMNAKRWAVWGVGAYLLIWLVELDWGAALTRGSVNLTYLVGSTLLLALLVKALFTLADHGEDRLVDQFDFWACLSGVVYFGCILPAMGLERYLSARSMETASRLLVVYQFLAVARYALSGVAFWQVFRTAPTRSTP